MINISEYKVTETIAEGVETIVYRAQRVQDQKSVILKTIKSDYQTIEEITQLKHEYEISKNLDLPGIIKAYNLENYQNSIALVLEDFGGEDLKKFSSSHKIELEEFLKIAIQLADTLNALHERQVIHKDIKPHNIIINNKTGQVKITDFSIASRLSKETASLNSPNVLKGTLAYMSPEQTGRMNRSIDYRSDFYSLGITFYELLTGQLPFSTADSLELVHCHIAKQPFSPHELNSNIPEPLSQIVMKLLAKTAEERYQSALGIKADLEICLSQLLQTGKIENFTPGKLDKFGQFVIPQKLYGRELEVEALILAFERISAGKTEMMLVSGYSGIGKSCLVNEVHKLIVRQRGYFISGKFDQFKRNIPYAALIDSFKELVRLLLTESSEEIFRWKQQLLEALGDFGQVIIDVIPEVEKIIGKQPEVVQLSPTESQNRFNRVFQKFIQVFAKKEHPLVIFLDDLQWADSASLKLIQILITEADTKYFLMIGAYRDNEVNAAHPLISCLEEIEDLGAVVNNITLCPLELNTVEQLIFDTLHNQTADAKILAKLVFNKTQGNPFFLTQLLQTLHQEKLLNFDFSKGVWQWDVKQIQTIGITDFNVVELMARNIQKLAPETQDTLKLAACIGNKFNLDILSIVNEKSQSETATQLWDALQVGLVLPLSEDYKIPLFFEADTSTVIISDRLKIAYKFLHDRVQQAAYSLIPEAQRKATHWKVGHLLLEHCSSTEIEENIFDIVNQLNFGVEFISNQAEKDKLAQLNLIAGQKAKAAAAYEAALKYLTVGIQLITESSWQSHYDLTLALHLETLEAGYLNADFTLAAALAEVVLHKATNLLDQVKAYQLQIQFYMAQNQMVLAIDTGLQVLEKLGVPLSEVSSSQSTMAKLPRLEDLEDFPVMTNPDQLAALKILVTIAGAAFITNPTSFLQIILTVVNLCVEHGHSALAAHGYAYYGMLLCGALENIDSGYLSGQIGWKLLEQFQAVGLKSKVYACFYGFIIHWKQHIRETLIPLQEGIQSALDIGDLEYTGYCSVHYAGYIFFSGEPLESVDKKQSSYIELLQKFKQDFPVNYIKIWHQLTLNLQGLAVNECRLVGESFDEVEMLPYLHDTKNATSLFPTYLAKAILFYLFKDYEQAVHNANLASEFIGGVRGMMSVGVHNFYYSLSLIALYPSASKEKQEEYIKLVETNQESMKVWATHSPVNYQHKYELVEAEKARVMGQFFLAMEYYERAIQGAKEQGYIQEEALANELAAEFYFSRGREKQGIFYIKDAYYAYIRWGAKAKVKNLQTKYPDIYSPVINQENSTLKGYRSNGHRSTTSKGLDALVALDLNTVFKAAQALSSEIVLDRLLDKLMKIVIENAGAQSGSLILEKDGKMSVEAMAIVDRDEVVLNPETTKEKHECLPVSILNYVVRTREYVVLGDASCEGIFTSDPYIIKQQPKSILCTPILYQGKLIGALYLENNLTTNAFTVDRLEILKILSSQAAISIENAKLYANLSKATNNLQKANAELENYSRNLEVKVEERTLELQAKNVQLQEQAKELELTLQELQTTQTQMIQREKMSSLGQLVAGIAHEINNPINFIYGNVAHVSEYTEDLLRLINIYERESPHLTPQMLADREDIDLEFLLEDLPKLLSSMKVGSNRIREIVLSLRNFSRLDEAEMKPVDIHDGIDSTLLILQHRLKAKSDSPNVEIIKNYASLPLVNCYAGQLNQVFMNLLSNAIDALEEYKSQNSSVEIQSHRSQITISTELVEQERIIIRIADNGPGINSEMLSQIFNPFFTTKPVGKGTGLGLSISYQIVVDKHGGQLICNSQPGKGTEFIVEIPVNYTSQRSK